MNKNCVTVEQKIFFEKHLIPDVNILLSDGCNLNCASCTNYSPLAKEHFASPEIIEKDVKRLSEIAIRVNNEKLVRLLMRLHIIEQVHPIWRRDIRNQKHFTHPASSASSSFGIASVS